MAITGSDCLAAKWVPGWVAELRDAHWKRPSDVVGQFPKARQENDGTFLFPIAGRPAGIHALIVFPRGLVLILSVKVLG